MPTISVLACISHGKSAGSGVLELAEADVRVEDMSMITKPYKFSSLKRSP